MPPVRSEEVRTEGNLRSVGINSHSWGQRACMGAQHADAVACVHHLTRDASFCFLLTSAQSVSVVLAAGQIHIGSAHMPAVASLRYRHPSPSLI